MKRRPSSEASNSDSEKEHQPFKDGARPTTTENEEDTRSGIGAQLITSMLEAATEKLANQDPTAKIEDPEVDKLIEGMAMLGSRDPDARKNMFQRASASGSACDFVLGAVTVREASDLESDSDTETNELLHKQRNTP